MRDAVTGSGGSPRGFLLAFIAAACGLLMLAAGRAAWFDALWVYRDTPPWIGATGGANAMIDLEMRRAKALHLIARPVDTVILGSSVVYRGIDPDASGASRANAYNLGISGMMGDELPVYASIIAAGGGGRRVVFGLDFYMFTDAKIPVRADREWGERAGRLKLLGWSLISERAFLISSVSTLAAVREPGSWKFNGFRSTPDRSPARAMALDAEQDRDMVPYEVWRLDDLDRAIRHLAGRKIILYLSPINSVQRRILVQRGLTGDFDRWRRDVAALAERHRVGYFDLTDQPQFDDYDPASGSSAHWLDNIHFRPSVGAWLLRRIGLAEPGLAELGPKNMEESR